MKFEVLALIGGVGQPRGSASPTWALLVLSFLSWVGGQRFAHVQVVLGLRFEVKSLKSIKFY